MRKRQEKKTSDPPRGLASSLSGTRSQDERATERDRLRGARPRGGGCHQPPHGTEQWRNGARRELSSKRLNPRRSPRRLQGAHTSWWLFAHLGRLAWWHRLTPFRSLPLFFVTASSTVYSFGGLGPVRPFAHIPASRHPGAKRRTTACTPATAPSVVRGGRLTSPPATPAARGTLL